MMPSSLKMMRTEKHAFDKIFGHGIEFCTLKHDFVQMKPKTKTPKSTDIGGWFKVLHPNMPLLMDIHVTERKTLHADRFPSEFDLDSYLGLEAEEVIAPVPQAVHPNYSPKVSVGVTSFQDSINAQSVCPFSFNAPLTWAPQPYMEPCTTPPVTKPFEYSIHQSYMHQMHPCQLAMATSYYAPSPFCHYSTTLSPPLSPVLMEGFSSSDGSDCLHSPSAKRRKLTPEESGEFRGMGSHITFYGA